MHWYDPTSSSFLQRDPFPGVTPLPATLPPYQYAATNPVG